ncbi:MAG: DotA/TraY family protein [Acidiferrobacterales bacterium]
MSASFIPSAAQAQSALTPVSTDQSVGLLNKLFGTSHWQSLYGHAIGLSGGSIGTFFHLLAAFDEVVFGFVALFVSYITIVSVVSTAHSGKILGERYHALWTPVRSAVAMVLLAPIPGIGISAVQGLLLLFVYMSIGGANKLATTATEYMATHGGALSALAPTGGQALSEGMLQSMTTQMFFTNFETQLSAPGKPTLQVFSPSTPTWTPDLSPDAAAEAANGAAPQQGPSGPGGQYVYTFATPKGFQPGSFGRVVIKCRSRSGPMCAARVSAIEQMAATLAPYVQATVNGAEAKKGASTISPTPASTAAEPAPPPLALAAQQYDAAVSAAVPREIQAVAPAFSQAMQRLSDHIAHEGWISLGSYYWQIGSANKALQRRVDAAPGWTGYDAQTIGQSLSAFDQKRLSGILEAMAGAQVAATPRPPTSLFQAAINHLFPLRGGAWYAQAPVWALMAGDPITNLQKIGDGIMNTEGPIVGMYMLDRVSAGAASRIGHGIPLVSGLVDLAGASVRTAERVFGPYLLTIIIGLTIIGATWAYYIPAVPFLLWTFGVVGWIILVIESLVASVLWAAGIATPEGEGFLGPRGEQGFMLFLNVMIRPSLMVLGFFASFLLMVPLGNLVGAGLAIFLRGENAGLTAWNPVTWIASAALISIVAVMLSHKIFGLITWVPDNVMRWLGHGSQQLGEHEAEGNTRAAFVGIANKAGQFEKKAQPGTDDDKEGEGKGKGAGLPKPGAGSGRGASPADYGEK